MKKNRVVLPLIIFLLLCFLPLSAYGLYDHYINKKEGGNPNHLHILDGVLYYYNSTDNLIGTYKCQNPSACDDAVATVDDDYLKHYEGEGQSIGVIADSYIIVQDGNMMALQGLTKPSVPGVKLIELALIKNYGTKLSGNRLIVKDINGKYGLLDLDSMQFDISLAESEYTFLGLAANFKDGELNSDRLAAEANNTWYVISNLGEKLTNGLNYPIYDYNDTYVYYIDGDIYYIYNYNNKEILPFEVITKIDHLKNINIIRNLDGEVIIYDEEYEELNRYTSEDFSDLDFKIENDKVIIYDENEIAIDEYEVNDESVN